MLGGLERPPLWATIAMVVGVIAIAVLLPVALNRGQPPASAEGESGRPAVTSSPSKAASPTPEAPDAVAVLGDEYSAGAGAVSPDQGFVTLMAADLGWAVTVSAEEATGYASGQAGSQFPDRVEELVATAPDVVLVQGSISDRRADATAIERAAAATFDAIRVAAPDARLIALGAMDAPYLNAAAVQATRAAVSAAATSRDVPFIDPSGWLEVDDGTVWADGVHPSSAGHRAVADRLAQEIELLFAVPAG